MATRVTYQLFVPLGWLMIGYMRSQLEQDSPVADLGGRGREGRAASPWGAKFFQFHAVFGKIWQIRMLVPPRGVGAPSSGKSWIRHCSQIF